MTTTTIVRRSSDRTAAADATSPPADTTGGGATASTARPRASQPAGDRRPGRRPAAGAAEIVISEFAFSEDITVPVGTTVVVRNDDSAGHTWTADDGAFDSGNIDGGGTFEFTFTEAGTFAFHCEMHPAMTGTITVTGLNTRARGATPARITCSLRSSISQA